MSSPICPHEIVVSGYSTQTRKSQTGAVSSVDVDGAVKRSVVNAAELLQGTASGVQVIANGQPGSAPLVRIRGFATPNDNNPLYIIDGVQTDDPFVANSISASDIDQINVLKDGAAAIYGARASNGVIVITTKNGYYNQENTVSFETYVGTTNATNLPTLLNAQQHGEMIWQSKINDGVSPNHPQYGTGGSPIVPSKSTAPPPDTTVNDKFSISELTVLLTSTSPPEPLLVSIVILLLSSPPRSSTALLRIRSPLSSCAF